MNPWHRMRVHMLTLLCTPHTLQCIHTTPHTVPHKKKKKRRKKTYITTVFYNGYKNHNHGVLFKDLGSKNTLSVPGGVLENVTNTFL